MHSSKPFVCYSLADTAVDVLSSDPVKYGRTRDEQHVKFFDGMKPTRFTLNRIDSDAFAAIVMSEPTESLKFRAAFQLAIARIDNLVDQKTGQPIECLTPSERRQVYGNAKPSMSGDDLLKVAPVYIEEIGSVAFARSFLPVGSAASYQLPPLLQSVLTARLYSQGADAIAAGRLLAASRKSAESEAGVASSTGEHGEKATAAIAMGKAKKPSARARRKPRDSWT